MRRGRVFASLWTLFRWCLFAFCVSGAAIGSAQERFRWAERRSVDREDWRFDREHRGADRWQPRDQVESGPIEDGYVFVEGKYIKPPYVIRLIDGDLLINDQVVEQTADVNEDKGLSCRGNVGVRKSFRRARSCLEDGGIVAAFSGQSLVVINYHPAKERLLEALAKDLGDGRWDDVLENVAGDRGNTWSTWVSHYKAPRDLAERIHLELDELKRIESANIAANSAAKRLYNLAYPLSVLGMLGVALAIGHLLLERPGGGDVSSNINPSPEARRLVVRSILFVIAFSALDLVWTILASQADAMSELNLLGGRLIQNPLALTAFKASATALTVGILSVFWQHRRVQFASWWACLICTLLTIRWLTFQSLFVT